MNILITGIHGFVGSNLVKSLSKNHTIYGLDIIAPEKEGVVKTFSWGDLESGVLPQVDAIIHLAGKAHDTKNMAAADVYFKVNTELTKTIYDYFLTSSAKKFIFFSTVKSAADRVEGEFLTEDIVPNPVGAYGESKIAAENYILANLPKGEILNQVQNDRKEVKDDVASNDKQIYIFRPCMIHGQGNKGNLNLLYQVVSKGIPWPLGAFENKRSFVSVDNLCFSVAGFLEKDIESGVYHIADDESLSTNELINSMCEAMGRKSRIWKIPRGFMNFVARIGTLLHLPLNNERLQKLTENYVVSNVKMKNALQVEKLPTTAREGILKTIRSFSK